ncbi:hypothetical protein EEL32_24315 [Brevibacillus laterosporus]|uniref:Uncharacterized protein n=1 Tax=Brevibacillus laterosporus TaxID=1465 RepID=A0A502HLC0_BRELA|nr:hypothetical protein [Brevibacillus laterosporus]QDX93171.1 hypothetical protein EEL30_13160 [Brevibacillus laterosporus]TPG75481.1 hypothetical protein EEL32_24315 [Brevibacillus laterosporus]
MNKFGRFMLYFFSFLFFPLGIIFWLVFLLETDSSVKKFGRNCLYSALYSFALFVTIGVINFVVS